MKKERSYLRLILKLSLGSHLVGVSVTVPVGKAGFGITCEYDSVETRLSPELHEMDHVPKPQRRVPSEDHAWLPEIVAEVAVDAGVVLQLVGLNELQQTQKKAHEEMLACLGGRKTTTSEGNQK